MKTTYDKSTVLENLSYLSIMYLTWITLHYVSAHLYADYCVAPTLGGYFLSPFIVNTPHCAALRWAIVQGAESINGLWLVLGTWFASKLIIKPLISH